MLKGSKQNNLKNKNYNKNYLNALLNLKSMIIMNLKKDQRHTEGMKKNQIFLMKTFLEIKVFINKINYQINNLKKYL